ncbi:hypothetical protein G6F16_003454 [Rhizopus arrhizus]|nr:hypothetical protein G6F21_005021 [Rhizopus arrhizus]KAG0815382.1 hypothetical protein G6F20_004032 [Rhizopus arrhizus]KAG0835547.1 hypothetical protein G6F19_004671 [Rhizopus arrhizus]KAG0841882.1 hypothetical protein G6F18_003030 [Rhizopus arrhizus]KAG0853812.1 hypothetical protein G6F17_006892 [Rhizopus arrhizus]
MPFWFYTPLYLHCRWKTRKYRMIGNRYRLIRQIGRGSTGLVYLAIDIKTHTRCAIKEICKQKNRQESSILKELGPHKNIIGFIEVIEDSGSIYLVMEMAKKGAIMDIVPHSLTEPYSNHQCKHLFKQLVNAVYHLHQRGIIHGDIKPENILLTNHQTVRLIDFGNASRISDMTAKITTGSPAFMAPELLKKVLHSPTSSDIWALGVTLYCLAYGHLPFEKSSFIQLYQDILTKPVPHSQTINPQLKDLINQLLEKDPNKRITLDKVKHHPWLMTP